jgi:hypothetical protein
MVEWRKLHNEELHEQYDSLSIIRVNKSRRMRWAGHVAHEGEGRGAYRVLVEGNKQRDNLEVPDVDGSVILSWFFRKWDGVIYCIDLKEDGDKWWAFVNAVMNLQGL